MKFNGRIMISEYSFNSLNIPLISLNVLSKALNLLTRKKTLPILIFFQNFDHRLYISPIADVERRRTFAERSEGEWRRRRDSMKSRHFLRMRDKFKFIQISQPCSCIIAKLQVYCSFFGPSPIFAILLIQNSQEKFTSICAH